MKEIQQTHRPEASSERPQRKQIISFASPHSDAPDLSRTAPDQLITLHAHTESLSAFCNQSEDRMAPKDKHWPQAP